MDGVIEALYIYDERNSPILSHTYTSRPLTSTHLLPLYLSHPQPRPNLIYLPNTNPPTLVFSLIHSNLLFLLTTSGEVEPLLVLEFLHRVIDALEEFLGAPLISHKIEANYDVVAQLLTEMCDGGTVATTEPNALRDVVEVEGWMGKLLGSITLPGQVKDFSAYGRSPSPATGTPSLLQNTAPALPWRRSNVRHTSNELYADVVETLNVTLAPSGRPLAAFANGTIAFTSKVSGVPDINMTLTSPSGKHNLGSVMELPVFHPCVRLARWQEQPGVLSFVPPDGRFILAGYEVDLLPFTNAKGGNLNSNSLKLPVNIEMKTGLGPTGSDFEVRVYINKIFGTPGSSGLAGRGGPNKPGSPSSPSIEELVITVPLPEDVRNLPEVRPTKGDATYNPGDGQLQWNIPAKELSAGTTYFGLKCTVTGPLSESDEEGPVDYMFEEPYQVEPAAAAAAAKLDKAAGHEAGSDETRDAKKLAQNKILMPSSALVSFAVKGWLPSGIRVESILVDTRKSRGLGEGVKPYKGVKYLTVSKGGIEIRC
ncbi:AP-3 complex subunit mu-1 [Cytospora mali]|uniref:AP-3 complex subunit mu-1 n=1 Tax=Cytospora mali TaxID=578113 RepID=A0A194UYJ7_CYTMA|nr:AP-3 complex subunit mu-1 [Valsa mali var. pyri (nom. inval.)]